MKTPYGLLIKRCICILLWCIPIFIFGKQGVNKICESPVIVAEPLDTSVEKNSQVLLTVSVTGSEPFKYQWQKDSVNLPDTLSTLQIDSFKKDDEGTYICIITNDCGNTETTPAVVSLTPSICLVTEVASIIDDNGYNLILINKESKIHYKQFNVYRESSIFDQYDCIGNFPDTSPAYFKDTTVDLYMHSNSYKITGVRPDSTETDISLCKMHKTMYLAITQMVPSGILLNWDKYIGFPYSAFHIYRSEDGGQNFTELDSVDSTILNWIDTSPPSGVNLFYYIAVVYPYCCHSSEKAKAGCDVFIQSVSNVVNIEGNRLHGIIISNAETGDFKLTCFPNPFNRYTTISFNLKKPLIVTLGLYDILGKKVATLINTKKQVGFNKYNLNASDYGLAPGIYILRLNAGSTVITKRLVEIR